MKIENNIIKHYLKNVYFITGTAYAGKSTMVAMLAKRYNMVECGENYHCKVSDIVARPDRQPNMGYFDTMKDWQEYVNRTPEEYDRWITEVGKEAAEFEIAQLIHLPSDKKVIVDTNIPLAVLKEIADYNHVAVMVSPQMMSVEYFFEREDPEKRFLLQQIQLAKDPKKTMENFKQCIAKVNSPEHYREYVESGFFTLCRDNPLIDTKEETMRKLAVHFKLEPEM